MVNGSICTFIDKSQLVIPDWYTLNGDLRFGAKASTDYIILLNYKKISNNWILDCSSCDDMDIGNWLKGEPPYRYLMQSTRTQEIIRPDVVNSLSSFYAELKPNFINESVRQNDNMVLSEEVIVKRNNKLKEESRLTILSKSPVYTELYRLSLQCEDKRRNYISYLKNTCPYSGEFNSYMDILFDGIVNGFKRRPRAKAVTGQSLIKAYLAKFPKLTSKDHMGLTAGEFVLNNISEVVRYMKEGYSDIFHEAALDLVRSAFASPEKVYAFVVAMLIGESTSAF